MSAPSDIRFSDGASYETYMGEWSLLVGRRFLDWLAPPAAAHWVDVGCGSGALTELLFERCAPSRVAGLDPSEAQLAFAQRRLGGRSASFAKGDAMALPYPDGALDAAVMALVIFFVPEPARGVAEMARVVRPGGSVSAYAWDMLGGGFPYALVHQEMATLGMPYPPPPSIEASGMDALRALWAGAGLVDIEASEIRVERSYPDFDAWWAIARSGPRMAPALAGVAPDRVELLQARLRARLVKSADGRITCSGRANAIRGRKARG
jgi:SAM-dependent methyltransferase